MTTAVLADLHLGGPMTALDTPPALERLLGELEGVDQVVLLGDVLSLRDAPLAEVLAAARPFFEGLGEAMGDRRIVVVPGNHDHRLAEPLLERRPLELGVPALELRDEPRPGSPGALGTLARWTGAAELVVSYPGLWIRPDVYATHGHYLDCHTTVPRPECVAARAMTALAGLPDGPLGVAHYEAVLAPIYAFAYSSAQSPQDPLAGDRGVARLARRVRSLAWNRLGARAGSGGPASRLAGAAVMAGGAAALRVAGLGSFAADLSPGELGRAGREAMAEVVTRLEIDAAHVIFGHTHHAGPLEPEAAGRLMNPGSWVYQPLLIGDTGARDPYWPGRYVLVEPDGPPRLRSVLADPALVSA